MNKVVTAGYIKITCRKNIGYLFIFFSVFFLKLNKIAKTARISQNPG